MAVRRLGPTPSEPKPHRARLGRVRVTIDDLGALIELLSSLTSSPRSHIELAFDGGEFDDENDLRSLSDVELRSLRIKADGVEVILNDHDAVAIGRYEFAEAVLRSWARARPSPRPPRGYFRQRLVIFDIILMTVFLVGLGYLATLAASRALAFTGGYALGEAVFSALFSLFVVGLAFALHQRLRGGGNFAAVLPFTIDEVRKNEAAAVYPRLGVIVAMLALLATAIGILIQSIARK